MKIIIEHEPWVKFYPYIVSWSTGTYLARFETEEEAREYCNLRLKGSAKIAEFEVSDEAPVGR